MWQLPLPSCSPTVRFTPSLVIRGKALTKGLYVMEQFQKLDLLRCIAKNIGDHAKFLPRYHSSALILHLKSFKIPIGNQVKELSTIVLIAST